MLAVVASQGDIEAAALAQRWQPYGCSLLTARDLSCSGWRHSVGTDRPSVAVIAGTKVVSSELAGVLVRMRLVGEQDLAHITPSDRPYVAAEMTAFLAWWLSTLACPVLNRPHPPSLTSPCWRREQWVPLAIRLGIPVVPARCIVRRGEPAPEGREESTDVDAAVSLHVIGDACLGNCCPPIAHHARRLARAVGVDLLVARFTDTSAKARLVSADPWANVTDPSVTDALLDYFKSRRSTRAEGSSTGSPPGSHCGLRRPST